VRVDRFTASSGDVWSFEEAGDGPVVVALHGVGGGAYFFRGLAPRLGGRYRVIATELPSGPGPDGSLAPGSLSRWAAGLGELIQSRANGPVALLGHSLGTILALELWRGWPQLIRGMVFVGGLPDVRDAARARLTDRLVSVRTSGLSGWGSRVAAGVFGSRALTTAPESIGMFERLVEAHPAATYIRNVEALLAASAADVVPTVTVPCLSLSGTDDNYAPPEFVATFIRRLALPCEQVVWPGVGHMPFFEVPEEFAAAVAAFLDRLGGAGN
jgi:pimeloyl-ACP methyl ester carboxylesterase